MHRKHRILWFALAFIGFWSAPARAQCGATPSSCRDCHETLAQGPFVPSESWHADHALGDFCSDCHGGAPTVHDDSAHLGLVDPLADAPTRCTGCHADKPKIADGYLSTMRTPRAPIAPEAPSKTADSSPRTPDAPSLSTHAKQRANGLFAALILLLALGGGAYVFATERARRPNRSTFSELLWRSAWSPYAAGALLGLVVTVSIACFGRRLSGAGAYQEIAGYFARAFAPHSMYWNHVIVAGEYWDVFVLLGAILGSLVAARAGSRFRLRTMPDTQWSGAFGSSVPKRWVIAFFGAALTAFAAGIAGGCTASLVVSGGAALSPAAFAFMAGMFAAGTPTAWLIYRRTKA